MLRFEHGVSSHGHLLAVVGRIRRCESCADEVLAMATDGLDAFVLNVLPIRFRKAELAAELGLGKFLKCGICNGHHLTTISSSQRVEARLESFDRFIFHDFSPMPSEAENTLPFP